MATNKLLLSLTNKLLIIILYSFVTKSAILSKPSSAEAQTSDYRCLTVSQMA